MAQPGDEGGPEGGERRVKLPPDHSGPRMLILTIALVLVFLSVIWYATFVVLQSRGPDLVVIDQESWENGTITVIVKDVRAGGTVILPTLNITIRTASGVDLYDGPAGDTVPLQGFNLTVTYLDLDHSQDLSKGDKVVIKVEPVDQVNQLMLSTLYLSSDERELAHMSIPP